MNIEDFSMTKPRINHYNNKKENIINILFKKRTRNKPQNSKLKSKDISVKTNRYLSNIKKESIKKDEECTSTFINYCEKKKHLSFYKGANISVSSIIYDANKTNYSSKYIKNNSVSQRRINIQKSSSQKNIFEHLDEINGTNNDKKKKKKDGIKSTINPYLDISKLTYKTDITSIRNKFSLLFSKEFDFFDKFIPSLYTLKFEKNKKEILCQLHNNSLSCIKYLSSIFLDQEIEHFKINEINLTKILTNLFNLFNYNNKINQYLIRHTKKYMMETNQEKQNNKDLFEVDDNTKILDLKKIIENKNEKIKEIKKEQFQKNNDYMINMYKLRSEKKDLVKLLLLNKNYYLKYKDSLKEIKEKNDIIGQKNIDYKSMLNKNFIEKTNLEDELADIQNIFKPIQEENKKLKEKINDLGIKLNENDEIIKNKNDLIIRLKENLMMKNEELNKYLYDLNKVKYLNDKLSFNYIVLKNKYNYFTNEEKRLINGDYNDNN